MRCVSTLFSVVALGFSLTAGPPAQLSVAAAVLEPQKKPISQKKPIPQKNPIPMSEASLKAGRTVYAKICRACHGLRGKGDGTAAPPGAKPANLVDAEWKHGGSDAEIFMTIKQGVKPYDVMEPWGNKLSDNEIWSVVNYLRDLATRAKR